MKKRLDQYTMAQFIDIACGDYSAMDADGEQAKEIAASLVDQYNTISDPASSKSRLLDEESKSRTSARIKLYRILLNLINVYGAYDDVRGILTMSGMSNIAKREDESLKAKIEQMLRTDESRYERMKEEGKEESFQNLSGDDLRASFDQQTARLMTHFKFAINHEAISASVYANLVNTACRQQRQGKS